MAQAAAVTESEGSPVISVPPAQVPAWRPLVTSDTQEIDVRRSQPSTVPAETPLALVSRAFASRRLVDGFAKSAGVRIQREYIGVPSAISPTCLVDDSPAAVDYFLSSLLALPRGGLASSVLFGVGRSVARRGRVRDLLRALAPTRIAICGVDGLLAVPGMRAVVVALSKDPNAKITVLLIPDGRRQPALAVKVATTDLAQSSLAAERRVLSHLRDVMPERVLATIPMLTEPPFLTLPSPAMVTTALPGKPMTSRYHAWRHLENPIAVGQDFAAAELWLAEFQGVRLGPARPIAIDEATRAVLARRFGAGPDFAQVMDRADATYARLGSEHTPLTPVHGDFWFGNLLMRDGVISGVVDWEAGIVGDEPVRDLVRFALTYALYLDRHTRPGRRVTGHPGLTAGEWGAGIEYAVKGEGWFPHLFRSFLKQGLSRLGADPACWHAASLAGLVDIAATADHLDFADAHWRLFARLSA